MYYCSRADNKQSYRFGWDDAGGIRVEGSGRITHRSYARNLASLLAPPILVGALACGGGDAGPMRSRGPSPKVPIQFLPGTFKPAGRLLQGRQGLAAIALSADRILVMGGCATPGGAGLNSVELYTPSTGQSEPTYAMNQGRVGHAVARINPSLALVTGGTCGICEVYDLDSRLFTPTGSMAWDRSRHTAIHLTSPPGVLIIGGVTAKTNPTPLIEFFDPNTGSFKAAGNLALAPGHSATLLPNGKILLVSHSTTGDGWRPFAALYDPASKTARATHGQPGTPREGHQSVLLVHPPKVLILGGNDGSGPLASAEWYDPTTEQFQLCPNPMLTPRTDFGAAIMDHDQVLLLGGTADGRTACASAERFDSTTQSFATTGALNLPRRHPCVLRLDSGKVLVLGGSNEKQGCLKEIEVYSVPEPSPTPEPPRLPWRPLP